MATFSLGSAGDISLVDDWPKVQSYLYKLNEQLRYMFNNLTPDDNYSEEARLIYVADAEKQAAIEVSLDHISLSMVDKDNVIAAINLSEEGVKIQGDKISMEGVVTVNDYFKIGLDGSMEAKNGVFSGNISASSMNSSDITLGGSGTAGSMTVLDASDSNIGSWNKNGVTIRKGTLSVGQFYTDDEYTQIGDFYVTNDWGPQLFCTEDMETGMASGPSGYGSAWFWAGWDGTGTDASNFMFLVNTGGQVWARDVGVIGYQVTLGDLLAELDGESEYSALRNYIEDIIDNYGGV